MVRFEPVIGLEIHVQLKTKTKMFCRCSNRGEYEPPNTAVCPVCLGQPGTLPVINAKAVEFGVLVGLALGGTITTGSKFDRKQYFYPDLPKGYQISQYDLPVVKGGAVNVNVPVEGGKRREIRVRIHRAHLEEDAAKLVHADDGTASFVDFNRGGTPLIEIVTEPDMRSPAEAKAFLQELRLIMRYLGVSDADMEKGHLRCDANVSIREEGSDVLNPKTEVKNINSFRSVERALEYEIKRQTKLALDGKPVTVLTTRGWDDVRGITVEQRTKEGASDYRYFPEPDLPPLMLHELADAMAARVPELPEKRRQRFQEEYGFAEADSRTFCDDTVLADYAEKVMSELQEWVMSKAEGDGEKHWAECKEALARLTAGWILTKLNGVMTERKIDIRTLKTTPEDFAELIAMLHRQEVTGPNAYIILEEMVESGADPSVILKEKNLGRIEDSEELRLVAGEIIVGNPKVVADWKGGKTNAVQFLVGQMMKATRGKAPPETARQLIEEELKKVS
ncbi:MAG TPA: Asp-tRNA(Asn)/Glu-tRNA(Gln) amidotransferase subunit GatB [Candidatus Binatia bacterium]|nr:Asp-tRNA(Asn)/Glu-tRNA(Gln) amidotransferase subunit GatB [Candidatus Binatia bacterium]